MYNNYVYQAGHSIARRTSAKFLDTSLPARYWQCDKSGAVAGSVLMWELSGPAPSGEQLGTVFTLQMGKYFANEDLDKIRAANPVKDAAPVKRTESKTPAASDVDALIDALLPKLLEALNTTKKKA